MCRKTKDDEEMKTGTNVNKATAEATGVSDGQASRRGNSERPDKCREGGKRRPEAAREL